MSSTRSLARASALVTVATAIVASDTGRADARQTRGLVVGGITPCSGLPPATVHGLPRYAAGTVFVLPAPNVRRQAARGGPTSIFSGRVIVKATVRVNQMYRFALVPGHDVLAARIPHSDVRPFVRIAVRPGKTTRADVPNMCI